jgi:hypothetical protein
MIGPSPLQIDSEHQFSVKKQKAETIMTRNFCYDYPTATFKLKLKSDLELQKPAIVDVCSKK